MGGDGSGAPPIPPGLLRVSGCGPRHSSGQSRRDGTAPAGAGCAAWV